MAINISRKSLAKIEEFLNVAVNDSTEAAAKTIGLGRSVTRAQSFIGILRKFDIDIPKKQSGLSPEEFAEFRAWKRSKTGV
jgi:hypothetical protein